MATISMVYPQGIKREMVTALQPIFADANFPIVNLRNRVYVGLEYPMTNVRYPAIYLTYRENDPIHNVGVGHIEESIGVDGTPMQVKHWMFTGTINFNILALSPNERDQLAAALINILAFGEGDDLLKTFTDQIMNSTYIDLQFLKDQIHPGGEVVGNPPWESETELTFGTSYSIDVLGEFYSNPWTGELVQIEHVQLHPYLEEAGPAW